MSRPSDPFGVEKPRPAGARKNRRTVEFLQDFHSQQLHQNCWWQVHFSQHVIYPLFSDGTSVDETVRWLAVVVCYATRGGTIFLWTCYAQPVFWGPICDILGERAKMGILWERLKIKAAMDS